MGALIRRRQTTKYPAEFASAYLSGAMLWLYDPDYALAQDDEFFEKARRDAVVADALDMRQEMIAGETWNVIPGGPTPGDKLKASVIETLIKRHLRSFTDARVLLAGAVFTGSSYGRIYGERRRISIMGLAEQNWWCPTAIHEIDKRRFRRRFVEGRIQLDYWPAGIPGRMGSQWTPVEHPQFLIQHRRRNREASLGYGSGISEPLYHYLRGKAHTLMRMAQGEELFAQGIFRLKKDASASVPSGTTPQQQMTDDVEKIRAMRSGGVIAIDSRDDLDLMEGSGTGWQMSMQALDYWDTRIRGLILGSNLPTQATAGGSYAMAEVQEHSTSARIQKDTNSLAESIDRDLIGLILALNSPQFRSVGLESGARPEFQIAHEKPSEPEVASRVAATALGAGIPLRKDEVYERLGYSVPAPGDEVIEARPASMIAPGFPSAWQPPPPPPPPPRPEPPPEPSR